MANEYVEEMSDVELSSDSEPENENEDGVSLVVFRRPALRVRTVEDVEIVPVNQRNPTDAEGSFKSKPRVGIVKEYIDGSGLGVLFNRDEDGGIILFHLKSVWRHESFPTDISSLKDCFVPGTKVEFLMRSFHGELYGMFSEEKILHQAVAVWNENEQPRNMSLLLKASLGEENSSRLEGDRKSLMINVKHERFLVCSMVRVQGEVAGYLTDTLGIIEMKNWGEDRETMKVFFHSDDVRIYRKDIRERGGSCKKLLPIGAPVTFDARRVHMISAKDIKYQAITVLAGYWGPIPFPTLLMTGSGSVAPKREIPPGSTFYYLDLSLPRKLMVKVQQLETILSQSQGNIEFDVRGVKFIKNEYDLDDWQDEMSGGRHRTGVNRSRAPGELLDTFKSTRMVETDLAVKITTREVESRTWYSPEAWEHGGLRLKKEEPVEEEASQAKRRKTS